MAVWISDMQRAGQIGWPELAWRNFTADVEAGSLFLYNPLASGVVVGTLSTAGGIVKGLIADDFLNGEVTIGFSDGDNVVLGSGALGVGLFTLWKGGKATITLTTATAQVLAVVMGTGLPPFEV